MMPLRGVDMLGQYSPAMLGALRIMTALLFLAHPVMTLFRYPAPNPFAMGDVPPLIHAAAIIELTGGTLILCGLFTRLAAFICAGEMAAAYFIVHAPQSFWPILNGGEAAIFFCWIFLHLVFSGPGAFSLDA